MAILKTSFNINSQTANANKLEMLKLVDQLDKNLEKSLFQGKDKHIKFSFTFLKLEIFLLRKKIDFLPKHPRKKKEAMKLQCHHGLLKS